MFTFFCTTCGVKLIARDNKMTCKILPWPKCGSMVLVHEDDSPTPPHNIPLKPPAVHKRFPEALTHETASGIIGPVSKEKLRSDILLEIIPPEDDVSETEVKTRMFLVGVLIGLSLFLLVALGYLMLRKPILPLPIFQEPVEQRLPNPLVEPGLAEIDQEPVDAVAKPPDKEPPEIPTHSPSIEPATFNDKPIQTVDDALSVLEKKMPDFVESSIPNIDIAAKLSLPILELNLNQQSLVEFVRFVSNLTEIPITLNIDEMKPLHISVKTRIAGQFKETTVDKILTDTLATLGLHWIATDRHILILPKETADNEDLTFDVSDFAEKTNDLKPDVLSEMIQKLVCPEKNVVVLPNSRLSIRKDENNRKPDEKSQKRYKDDIQRFLEQLRVVRHLPQKTELTGESLAPEAFGWDKVMETMTLNYYQTVPLYRVVTQLETITGLTILVDHQSLHRALCPFTSIQTTIQCNQGTVNDAMELSLDQEDSVALTYRIIDHQTLEITTSESARHPDKMVVEVHRYQLQEDETPEDIVLSLRSAVEPESWFVSELPETRYGGNIVIDTSSSCLLVRQSQPAQRQIRLYLSVLEP